MLETKEKISPSTEAFTPLAEIEAKVDSLVRDISLIEADNEICRQELEAAQRSINFGIFPPNKI